MDTRPTAIRRFSVDFTGRLRAIRHHRRSRPLLAAALVAGSLWALHADHERTRATRAEWGEAAAAWVVTGDLDAGHVLGADDVRHISLPPVALPLDAVDSAPIGRQLIDAVGTGEVLRSGRLADAETSANSALVGADRGAVTLPAPAPHVGAGDRVDLYALLDGSVLAADAEVIAVVDGLPVVAVATLELGAVIQALSFGDVVPVLVG